MIPLKSTVDAAIETCPSVEHVFVLKRNPEGKTPFVAPRYPLITTHSSLSLFFDALSQIFGWLKEWPNNPQTALV